MSASTFLLCRPRDESAVAGVLRDMTVDVMVRMSHAMRAVGHNRSCLGRISRITWTDPKCALKTPYNAANDTANNSADRSRRVIPNIGAVGSSIGNALRVSSQR